MCACTCSLSSRHMRTWGWVAIHRLGRGLSRSWPCGPCCGPSSLQNSEKKKLCFNYPADGVSIWQPPDNKYNPQLRPKWLSSCSLTQLEDSSDSTQSSSAMPQLRPWATHQVVWAPHTHYLSSSSQQMWKQVWCSSYQQWRNRRQKAEVWSLTLDTIPKLGVRWPSDGVANLTTAHEHRKNHRFAME